MKKNLFSALIFTDVETPDFNSSRPLGEHELCGLPMTEWVRRACIDAGAQDVLVTNRPDSAEGEAWRLKQTDKVLVLPAAVPLITPEELIFLAAHQDGSLISLTQEDDVFYITDRKTFAEAEEQLRRRVLDKHFRNGVALRIPETVFIGPDVVIGRDTVIEQGCILLGNTVIGEGCTVGAYSRITDTKIGDGVQILCSVLDRAAVGSNTTIGPFAYLRPQSQIGERVRIGDFVEIKNSNIGNGTKVSHLTYVGDSDVGENVNFGCGTVTANYDGKHKYRTTIGDGSFIGCNTNLIAPITVGQGVLIAAGSTLTESVPDGALAIARGRQTNKLKRSPFGADQICTRKQEEEK